MALSDGEAALVRRFAAGPGLVRDAFSAIQDIDASFPDEWSAREIIAHLADAEVIRSVRIRLILGEDEPLLPAFDENLWRERMAYGGADAESSLSAYESILRATAELLERCDDDALDRQGIHPAGEFLSVRTLVERGVEHARDHVQQLLQMGW
jgi:hypothetical protein